MQEHEFESDASDFSNETDSSSSRSTTSSSSTDESNSNTNEVLTYKNETFTFPRSILDNPMVFKEFFSIETWKSLPENYRLYLKKKYLPNFPDDNLYEQEKTIHMLFSSNITRFDKNVFVDAYKRLEEGNFRPEIYKFRKSIAKSRRREHKFKEYERISQLAKYLMIAREKLLCSAYNRPLGNKKSKSSDQVHINNLKEFRLSETLTAIKAKRRYYRELKKMASEYGINDFSEDECFEHKSIKEEKGEDFEVVDNTEVRVLKTTKRKKDSNVLEANSCLLNNKTLRDALIEHKRRKLEFADKPEMDISDIRLRDIYTRTQISFEVKKNALPSYENVKIKEDVEATDTQRKQKANRNNINKQHGENNYYLHSESEDDDILNRKQDPPLHEAFVTSKKLMASPLVHTKLENEEKEIKKETSILQQYQGKVSAATVSDLEGIDMMGLPVDLDDSCDLDLYSELNNVSDQQVMINSSQTAQANVSMNNPPQKLSLVKPFTSNKGLNQDTHACFLSLLRDIFCSTPNHRMKMDELKEKINIWSSGPIAALNEWYSQTDNWYCLVPSAINFLTGEYFEPQDDFVPYIEYKINLNIYQWIGAGRDTDNHLLALCKKWLVKRSMSEKNDSQTGKNNSTNEDASCLVLSSPQPRSRTTWKVRPATKEEMLEFQSQERVRFEQAHKSFTYRQYGYESIVGPVKGIYAPISNLSKSRNINRQSGNRPNYITVLTLVRDATARLPNGEGTKSDICELLKSSQYLNVEAKEKELDSIVSGALDRMSTEKPPCVRYDESRKIWIYMHRNKSESEFDYLHNQNQLKTVLNRKVQSKKVKNQVKSHNLTIRSSSATKSDISQSLLKSPTSENESNVTSTYAPISKASIQKVVMTRSSNTINLKTHTAQSQHVKVVTTSGVQTMNMSTSSSTANPQIIPLPSTSNQLKPILISTSSQNISNSQSSQSFILPVLSNTLVDSQQQPQQIKVLSTIPNTIIANSNILSSKFLKSSTNPTSLALRAVNASTPNPTSVVSRNIVRITNSNIHDSKPKIVSIQNPTLQSTARPAITKTISIVKSSVGTSTSQKSQVNQSNKKIISLGDLQHQKNVIIQQAVQSGQLIHKIINVTPAQSQHNQNIINPQIIQIQPPTSISSKSMSTINVSGPSNQKSSISISKQAGANTIQLSSEKGIPGTIRAVTVSNKNQPTKQISHTNKVLKPSTQIRQTQTIAPPVVTKVLGSSQSQIISLDNLIQKQTVTPGQCVKIPTSSLNITKGGQAAPSSTNLIQISTSSQGQVTQYAVVSGSTASSLQKVQNISTTTSNSAQVGSKIIQTIGNQQVFNTKLLAKSSATSISPANTIRMVNATNLNLGSLKGKSVIIASTTNSKQTTTSTTSSSSVNQVFIQNSNMVLSGQGVKIQRNVGNMQLVDQIVPRTTTTLLSSSATTTIASSNVGTISVNTTNINNPRTVVIGSSRPSELQNQSSIKTVSGTQSTALNTSQHIILGNAVKGSQIKSPSGQQRIVLAVQGGSGQILLPQHFQGGTLNIKSLQGLKVVSLAGNNSGHNSQPQSKK